MIRYNDAVLPTISTFGLVNPYDSSSSSAIYDNGAVKTPLGSSANYPIVNLTLKDISAKLVEDGLTNSTLDKYFWRPIIGILDFFSGVKTDVAPKSIRQIANYENTDSGIWSPLWEIGVEFSVPGSSTEEYRTSIMLKNMGYLNDIGDDAIDCIFRHINPPHNNGLKGLNDYAMYDKCTLEEFPSQPEDLAESCGDQRFSMVECSICSVLPNTPYENQNPYNFPSNWSWCVQDSSSWSEPLHIGEYHPAACIDLPGIKVSVYVWELRKTQVYMYPFIGMRAANLSTPCKNSFDRYLEAITPQLKDVCYKGADIGPIQAGSCSDPIRPFIAPPQPSYSKLFLQLGIAAICSLTIGGTLFVIILFAKKNKHQKEIDEVKHPEYTV